MKILLSIIYIQTNAFNQNEDITFLDNTQRKMKMNIPWKALVMVNR